MQCTLVISKQHISNSTALLDASFDVLTAPLSPGILCYFSKLVCVCVCVCVCSKLD